MLSGFTTDALKRNVTLERTAQRSAYHCKLITYTIQNLPCRIPALLATLYTNCLQRYLCRTSHKVSGNLERRHVVKAMQNLKLRSSPLPRSLLTTNTRRLEQGFLYIKFLHYTVGCIPWPSRLNTRMCQTLRLQSLTNSMETLGS